MWESFAHQARIFWKFDFLNDFCLAWLWHAIAWLWHAIAWLWHARSEPKSPSDGIHDNLEQFGTHRRIPGIPRIPSDSPEVEYWSGTVDGQI